MHERLRDEADMIQEQNVFLFCHSDDAEAIEETVGQYIEEHFHPRRIYVNTIGSISSHTGLGTLITLPEEIRVTEAC